MTILPIRKDEAIIINMAKLYCKVFNKSKRKVTPKYTIKVDFRVIFYLIHFSSALCI